MTRRRFLAGWVAAPFLFQACLFRRKKKTEAPKIYSTLGTIQQVSANSIAVQGQKGIETFAMTASTVRGSDFRPGMYVHVYYTRQSTESVATMVVEKVK